MTPAPAKMATKIPKAMPKTTVMIRPTTRPARISQPTSWLPQLPCLGEHVADTHVLLPVLPPPCPESPLPRNDARRFHVCSRSRLLPLRTMRDCTRREFLKLAGMAAAGTSLVAAGCGSQPAADPPASSRLASPSSPGGGTPAAGRRQRRQPRRRHGGRRRRAGRHEGVRGQGRRRHRQAQHLHRLPRAGVRGDDQSRGRRHAGEPLPPRRRLAACASWTSPSAAPRRRRTG